MLVLSLKSIKEGKNMTKVKRIIFSLIAALGLAMPMLAPVAASAQNAEGSLKCGANLDFTSKPEDCEISDADAGERVDDIITNVINIISLIVGVVAVIMIIIGGLRYVTSGGDSGQVGNAKNTIIYAIVGLVVVALAQVIVRFVVNSAT